LEERLSRAIGPIARRLVPDAARRYGTLSEIRQALAAQIEDPRERDRFLQTTPGVPTDTTARPQTSAMVFDAAALERLAQTLAPYLGPIAKVLVSRTARTARTVDELHQALAAELPSTEDRRRFLEAVRSTL
jgi:hypothetical protein